MSAVVILENDNDKVRHILTENSGFGNENVCIVRSVSAAQMLMTMPIGKVRLFVDYELDPGCGSGFEFLEWAIKQVRDKILDVTISTFSNTWRKEMAKLCTDANIPVATLKPPFSMDDSGQLPTVKS